MHDQPSSASSASRSSQDGGPAVDRGRRRLLLGAPALAGALASAYAVRGAAQTTPGQRWCASWGCAPVGPPPSSYIQTFTNQTLRLIVRASVGGTRVRIKLSNEMGAAALRIGSASIALRLGGADVVAGTIRSLNFGGQPGIVIPAGAPAISDPVALSVPQFADLAVSIHLPLATPATTFHNAAYQANYVSTTGNHTIAASFPLQRAFGSWPFLTEVDVDGGIPVLVAAGDSLTDGVGSTSSTNRRWTDWLARRAQAELGGNRLAVVNRGISANRLLADDETALVAGRDLLERFDRDVLGTAGARALAVLIGINDIVYSPSSQPIQAESMIAGYLQLIERAHAHGLQVLGATLPPFRGFVYYLPEREAVRQSVNAWMRASGAFDVLADADVALRDPGAPLYLRADLDSGDHVHPNDAGYQALANAMPLGTLASLLDIP